MLAFVYWYPNGRVYVLISIGKYVNLSSTLPEIDPAYPYHLVFLIWYPYSLVFLIWYPYALTSLYGTAHCSGYGVAMGCYGLFIVTRTAIVTSQWYDRYCFTEYMRTWARHPTTPWQHKCTAITDSIKSIESIDSLLDSMWFVTHFWETTPYILRDAIVVLVQSQCYSINARDFGPRTPYRVGGLAGDVMRSWVSHSLVNDWIYNFKASHKRNTLWLHDTVRQTSLGKSAAGRSALRPLTSLGMSAWPYRVTTKYSYYVSCIDIHTNEYIHICFIVLPMG